MVEYTNMGGALENLNLFYIKNLYIVYTMTFDRRFLKADIQEVIPQAWILTITYSYYGLYDFSESFTLGSLNLAKDTLLRIRCSGDRLRITDHTNLNIVI